MTLCLLAGLLTRSLVPPKVPSSVKVDSCPGSSQVLGMQQCKHQPQIQTRAKLSTSEITCEAESHNQLSTPTQLFIQASEPLTICYRCRQGASQPAEMRHVSRAAPLPLQASVRAEPSGATARRAPAGRAVGPIHPASSACAPAYPQSGSPGAERGAVRGRRRRYPGPVSACRCSPSHPPTLCTLPSIAQ